MDQYTDGLWRFRRPVPDDLYPISQWVAEATGRSERWRRLLYKQMLWEFERKEKMLRPTPSWMVTYKGRRRFFLELSGPPTGAPAEPVESFAAEIFLTAPPQILKKYTSALVLWRRAIAYLRDRYPGMTFRVLLDSSRQVEMQVLERLGLREEDGYYIL
ncbi:MAG: hypothetical protein JST68_07320 [Bacteroidetes bacterium]|nr:hypothetical protein [Bacteroidota bacterium]